MTINYINQIPHKGPSINQVLIRVLPGLTKVKPVILPRLQERVRERIKNNTAKSQSSEIAYNKMQHMEKGNPQNPPQLESPFLPTLVMIMTFNNRKDDKTFFALFLPHYIEGIFKALTYSKCSHS